MGSVKSSKYCVTLMKKVLNMQLFGESVFTHIYYYCDIKTYIQV